MMSEDRHTEDGRRDFNSHPSFRQLVQEDVYLTDHKVRPSQSIPNVTARPTPEMKFRELGIPSHILQESVLAHKARREIIEEIQRLDSLNIERHITLNKQNHKMKMERRDFLRRHRNLLKRSESCNGLRHGRVHARFPNIGKHTNVIVGPRVLTDNRNQKARELLEKEIESINDAIEAVRVSQGNGPSPLQSLPRRESVSASVQGRKVHKLQRRLSASQLDARISICPQVDLENKPNTAPPRVRSETSPPELKPNKTVTFSEKVERLGEGVSGIKLPHTISGSSGVNYRINGKNTRNPPNYINVSKLELSGLISPIKFDKFSPRKNGSNRRLKDQLPTSAEVHEKFRNRGRLMTLKAATEFVKDKEKLDYLVNFVVGGSNTAEKPSKPTDEDNVPNIE